MKTIEMYRLLKKTKEDNKKITRLSIKLKKFLDGKSK
jgi:hypothetical protein